MSKKNLTPREELIKQVAETSDEVLFATMLSVGMQFLPDEASKVRVLKHHEKLLAAEQDLERQTREVVLRNEMEEAATFAVWGKAALELKRLTRREAGELFGCGGRQFLQHALGKKRIPVHYAEDIGRVLDLPIPAHLIDADGGAK